MAMNLGSLVVSLAANTAQFTGDLGKAAHLAAKRFEQIERAGQIAAAKLAIAMTAAAGSMVLLTKTAANTVDEMGKMAQRVGVGVESLSALAYAAGLADVSIESLGTGLKQLSKNMADTEAGTGDARQAFAALGISVTDSSGRLKDTNVVFREVSDKFAGMQDGAGKTAIAMRIFGKSGSDLIPLLNEGGAGLDNMADRAKKMGLIFTLEAAKSAQQFNDNLRDLGNIMEGVKIKALMPLVEAIGKAAGAMAEASLQGKSFFKVMAEGLKTLFTGDALHKWNVEMTDLVDRLGDLQNKRDQLNRGDTSGFGLMGESKEQTIKRARGEIDAAIAFLEAKIKSHQAIRKTLAPDEEKKGGEKTPPPKLVDPEATKKALMLEIEQWEWWRQEEFRIQDEAAAATIKFRQQELEGWTKSAQNMYDIVNGMSDAELEAYNRMIEQRRASQDILWEITATAADREREAFLQRQADLEYALESGALTREQYQERIEQAAAEHEGRMSDIEFAGLTTREKFQRMSLTQQVGTVVEGLSDMTAAAAQHNKTYFEINKVVSTANAIVKGIEAVQSAYAWGSTWGGPAGGAAMAAIAAGATAVQVAAIQATQFGSTTSPSLAGSTIAPPVQVVQQPQQQNAGQTTLINLQGEVFSDKTIRSLFGRLNENSDSGARFVVI